MLQEPVEKIFLKFSIDKLQQLNSRIKDCVDRLSVDQVWLRQTENENAVGNLVLHLAGNVRQWICAGVGQQPDIRDRDGEFAARGDHQNADLQRRLEDAVSDAIHVLENLTAKRLIENITVQGYSVSVLEAVYHVVEHFAGHTGQIIFAAKLLTGQDLGHYKHLGKAGARRQGTP